MGDLVGFDALSREEGTGDLSALEDRSRSIRDQSRQLVRTAGLHYADARLTHRRAIELVRQSRQTRRARCGPIFAMADLADQADDAVVLAALIDAVEDYAVCTLDPVGGVTTWNIGAYRVNGYAPHEIVGRHFSVFFVNDDVCAGKPQQLLAQASANGRAADQGWRMRKNRSRFWASVIVVALLDGHGSVRGFLEVTRDDTDRHVAEGHQRELDALRAQLAATGDLKDAVIGRIFAARSSLRRLSNELHDPRLRDEVDAAINELDETINDLGTAVGQRAE